MLRDTVMLHDTVIALRIWQKHSCTTQRINHNVTYRPGNNDVSIFVHQF